MGPRRCVAPNEGAAKRGLVDLDLVALDVWLEGAVGREEADALRRRIGVLGAAGVGQGAGHALVLITVQ